MIPITFYKNTFKIKHQKILTKMRINMSINISVPPTHELKPRITVIGVGGAGCNAVNNMISSHLEGVEFVVSNTDAQSWQIASK